MKKFLKIFCWFIFLLATPAPIIPWPGRHAASKSLTEYHDDAAKNTVHELSGPAVPQSQEDTTIIVIELDFAGVESPPACFLPHKLPKRPKIGLALSGGGARAIAQIGVLQVLEENAIPVDFIVGSSMGSVIGGLYAAGYSPEQIWETIKSIRWNEIMVDTPPRTSLFLGQKQERDRHILQLRFSNFKPYLPQAYTPGQKLMNILSDLTLQGNYSHAADFDHLRIPLRIITTDLITGRKIVIRSGDLAEAMRASVGVPLLFTPVERDSMLLLDGGVVDNIPVDEARQEGIDLVLAVDTTSKLRTKAQINAPWEVADQVTTIMQRERNEAQSARADVLIRVDIEDRTAVDFTGLEQVLEAGRQAASEKIEQIKLLMAKAARPQSNEKYAVAEVHITGYYALGENYFADWIKPLEGKEVSRDEIKQTLEKMYASGYFANAAARLTCTPMGFVLTFAIEENPVLKKITFTGNTVFPDSTLRLQMSSKPGLPINHATGVADLQRITQLYRTAGYSLAHISSVQFDSLAGELTLAIDEGRLTDVRLEGNQRTLGYVIRREFPLRKGDIFNSVQAERGITNIYSTGLFDVVHLGIGGDPSSPRLVIKLEEK